MRRRHDTGRWLAALFAVAMIAACDAPERWILAGGAAHPTAIDYWSDKRLVLVGGYQDGTIHALNIDGTRTDAPLIATQSGGPARVLRLRVDNARGLLWVLDSRAAYVYQLAQQRVLARIALPLSAPDAEHCMPDLAVDAASGVVYVTDPRQPMLYRIAAGATPHEYLAEALPLYAPHGTHAEGYSALATLPGSAVLIGGSAKTGHVWRIDPAARSAERIALPRGQRLPGVCGMSATATNAGHPYRAPRDHQVYAATSRTNEVHRLHFSPNLKWAGVNRVAPLVEVDHPVGVVIMQGYLVVANAQLGRHPDFGGNGTAPAIARMSIMPAALEAIGPIAGGR